LSFSRVSKLLGSGSRTNGDFDDPLLRRPLSAIFDKFENRVPCPAKKYVKPKNPVAMGGI
jgi:hypothetical protein